MSQTEIDNLIELLARLPGIGPRSARRLALSMLKKPDSLMRPLAKSLLDTADSIVKCSICGNLDTSSPCNICLNESRDKSTIIVVEEVADLWALERASVHKGLYHVLGGTLSAIYLLFMAPSLSKVSLSFRSPDYFALMILGLTAIAAFSSKGQFLKAMMMVILGLMLASLKHA